MSACPFSGHGPCVQKIRLTGQLLWQEERQASERRAHSEQLRAQIAVREEMARQAKAAKAAEGTELRRRLAEHKALIEVSLFAC